MIARFHYDREALTRFLDEEAGTESAEIASHVEECDDCQSTLESLMDDGLTMDKAGSLLRSGVSFQLANADEGKLEAYPTFLEPSDDPDSIGRFSRYEIRRILGRGGMGIVMQALDTSLGRHCAVKVLAPELASSAAARKRFSREAKSAAAVVHPHVVPIQTVDEHNGLPYLVMPVVEGQSLQQRVDSNGPLSIIETVRISAQVAEGLSAAHDQGLVHRDIKPANVLLENSVERVQITDFGLARAVDDASMTRSGVIAGTPQYMSPEQAHGDSIDHRSDLFSLGSLIYFMLTGRSPFRAETTMGVLNRIVNDEPRPLRSINPEVPEWLEQIVEKLLAKSPEGRFQTAKEVAELLQGWHAHLQQPDVVKRPSEPTALAAGITSDTLTPAASAVGSRNNRIRRWLIASAFCGFLAFAGYLIVLELNKGTLTIESDADNVPIQIVQGDEVVKELTISRFGESIRIAAGNYAITIDGEFTGIEVQDGTVSLNRGGVATVKITHSPSELDENELFMAGNDEMAGVVEDGETVSPAEVPSTSSEVEQAYEKLNAESSQLQSAYSLAADQAENEVELNRVYEELDPRKLMPTKYLALAEKYRGTETGLQALVKVAEMARSVGDPDSQAAKGRVEAVKRLLKHYLHHEGLESIVATLGTGPFVPEADDFLQSLVETSPYRKTQAEALIGQIIRGKETLTAESQLTAIRTSMKERLGGATSETRTAMEAMLSKLEATDFEQLRDDLNEKLNRLADMYSDVEVQFYGTGGLAAQRLTHAINQVIVGGPAPEIAAADIDGKPFRLSKLRGKIVVLVFTQSTSDDYGEMYAPMRQLVAKYWQFPVRFVGIMSNLDKANMRAASERGDLPWTVIPQPLNGPLQLDWGIEGFPSVYIVDAEGVLHPKLHMPYWGAGGYDTTEIDEKLEELIRNASLKVSEVSSKDVGLPHSLKAVAMVRVVSRLGGINDASFFPVDRAGVLLRPRDFSKADTDRYLHIIVPDAYPTGDVGAEFGDSHVQAAARLAHLLAPYREELGLSSIGVHGDLRQNSVVQLEVTGKHGERWFWGSSPGSEVQPEPQAELKLKALLSGAISGTDLRRVQDTPTPAAEAVSATVGQLKTSTTEGQGQARQNPAFATPESLMQYAADCQSRGDVAGTLECYSDKLIDQFAANYLVGATAILEMHRNTPDDELQEMQRKEADELEELLQRSMIDNAPLIAKAGLYQAAGSIRESLRGDQSREPTQDELTLMAAAAALLKNPRQFILEVDAADKTFHDKSSKSEKPKTYRIETNAKGTWAIDTEDRSRMELKKFDGRWWIDDPWTAIDY